MGRVDLALRAEEGFERIYAIKRLQPQLQEHAEFRQMFLEEARLAGLLRHANVVSVLDVGVDKDGPYLVMDYYDGLTLSQILRHHTSTQEPLPLQLALRLLQHAARGIHAAHELRTPEGRHLGLVHRDVSPQNILVGFDGAVRVMDFGIAKAAGFGERTSTGILKGKIGYMAPEQLRFEPATRASDLFALGIILFQLVARGRHPYPGKGMERARRVLANDPQPDLGEVVPECPVEVVRLSFELLASDPDARLQDASEVASRLELIVADLAGLEGPRSIAEYMRRVHGKVQLERREAIEAAVRALPVVEAAPVEDAALEVAALEVAALEAAAPQRARWKGVALAALVGLAGVGAALAYSASTSAVTPAPVRTEAPEQDTIPESASPPATEREAAPEDAPLEGPSEAATTRGADEQTPERGMRRPRVRTQPRRGVPVWEWDEVQR